MGREVRRVPPHWDHPVEKDNQGRDRFVPMHDQTFEDAAAEWLADFDRIRRGDMDDFEKKHYPRGAVEWAAENRAPDPETYRPWKDDEATWFQVWETVSEGTPVTPPFATKEELVDYLAENGDFWDQRRCHEPDWRHLFGGTPGVSAWGRERAEGFVRAEWAPSMVAVGGKWMSGTEFVASRTNRES